MRDNADPAKTIIEEHYAANELSEEENICHFDTGETEVFQRAQVKKIFLKERRMSKNEQT